MKKLLTILLTMLMALTIGTVNVFADDHDQEVAVVDKKEKINNDFLKFEGDYDATVNESKAFDKDGKVKDPSEIDSKESTTIEVKLWNGSSEVTAVSIVAIAPNKKSATLTLKETGTLIVRATTPVEGGSETFEWNITVTTKLTEVPAPKVKEAKNLVYTGSKIKGFVDDSYYGVAYTLKEGSIEETDAGTYSATFTLEDGYKWIVAEKPKAGVEEVEVGKPAPVGPTDPTADYTVSWTISKKEVTLEFEPHKNGEGNKSKGEAVANTGDTAEIKVTNYENGMILEYCEHGGTYQVLPVTKVGDDYYVYLPKTSTQDHWDVRVSNNSENYKHAGNEEAHQTIVVTEKGTYTANADEMYVGEDDDLVITCTRDMEVTTGDQKDRYGFSFLTVDGKVLEKDVDYTVVKGSTKATLNGDFLETLAVGEHAVGFHYTDGMHVEGKVIVKAKPTPKKPTYVAPKTGIE